VWQRGRADSGIMLHKEGPKLSRRRVSKSSGVISRCCMSTSMLKVPMSTPALSMETKAGSARYPMLCRRAAALSARTLRDEDAAWPSGARRSEDSCQREGRSRLSSPPAAWQENSSRSYSEEDGGCLACPAPRARCCRPAASLRADRTPESFLRLLGSERTETTGVRERALRPRR
jgi:hypothetical protein